MNALAVIVSIASAQLGQHPTAPDLVPVAHATNSWQPYTADDFEPMADDPAVLIELPRESEPSPGESVEGAGGVSRVLTTA